MNLQKQKELILSLIKDDLTNCKLVNALNGAGLNAYDYSLNLSGTIFNLVGIDDLPTNVFIYKKYFGLTKKVNDINITEEQNNLDSLTEEIYSYLLYEKSKLS